MAKDKALKQALEALENISVALREEDVLGSDIELMLNAITAIEEALAQPEQLVAHREGFWCVDLTCKKCYSADFRFKHKSSVDKKSLTTPAQPEQEALYGMNQDDWKDLTDAVKKVRDGRGIYLACRPADVFQEWFLALGTAKLKEKNT
jgi:hypothetical protein